MSKWINCRKCGHEYNNSLSRCPNCSTITLSSKSVLSIVIVILICLGACIGIVLGFTEDNPPSDKTEPSSSDKTVSSNVSSTASSNIPSSTNFSKPASSTPQSSSSKPSSSSSQQNETVNLPKIGSKKIGDFYYTTLPKYYLEDWYEITKAVMGYTETFDTFAYSFTEKEKDLGFTQKLKNSDGSVTYKMPENKFTKLVADKLGGFLELLAELKKQDYIDNAEYKNTDTLNVYVNKKDLNSLEKANILLTGLTLLDKKFFSISDNKAVVNIIYPDNSKDTINLPEDIK